MNLILPQSLWGRLNERGVASVFNLSALGCTIQTDGQNIVTSFPPMGIICKQCGIKLYNSLYGRGIIKKYIAIVFLRPCKTHPQLGFPPF